LTDFELILRVNLERLLTGFSTDFQSEFGPNLVIID